eukprot:TRINITY_DN684_c0_g1_i1.p1 TRINITY_DN684_c0_g1~~TRINITY_DN684_c0_g1_i1.p1  ORF type:complete len:181 (-),score=3.59 TRINITY_DN684_c0_g1_i1:409-951(-)
MSLHMHSHEDDSNGHKQPPSDFSDFSICPTPTTSNIFSSITYSPSVPPSVPPSVLPSVSPPLTHFTLPVSTVEESPVVLVAAKRARNLNKRLDKINKLIAQRDSGEIVLNNDQVHISTHYLHPCNSITSAISHCNPMSLSCLPSSLSLAPTNSSLSFSSIFFSSPFVRQSSQTGRSRCKT